MLILPKLTLVTGGASSGKSNYAEWLIRETGLQKTYLATAQIWDDEMRDKVRAHQKSRGDDWHTHETGTDLAAAIDAVPAGHATLLDCMTLWLTAMIMDERDPEADLPKVLAALSAKPGPVVVVTNEVGQGIVPDTSLGRRFRNIQGRCNQAFAVQADAVVAVMSGLPFALKGTPPLGTQ